MWNRDSAIARSVIAGYTMLILSACAGTETGGDASADSVELSSPSTAPSPEDAPVLLTVPEKGAGYPQARVAGALQISSTGCFSLDDYVLIAPYGSTVVKEGQAINIPGKGEFQVGEVIEGGGGHYPADEIDLTISPERRECIAGRVVDQFVLFTPE